jgi:hypothetical protein
MVDATTDTKNIFIKHIDKSTIWVISRLGAAHSALLKESIIDNPNADTYGTELKNPLIISSIKVNTIDFIIAYLEFYKCNIEAPAPEHPIKNIHISIILDKEYHLFKDLYNDTDTIKVKILKLNDHIETSMHFGIKHLHKKLCAIIAFILKDLNSLDIQKLSE